MAEHEPVDAYDPALVRLAKLFGARSEGFLQEKGTASVLDIPAQDWPLVGLLAARNTYRDATDTMVASAQEGSTYSRALVSALDRVRQHYSAADFASTPVSLDGKTPAVAAPSSAKTINSYVSDAAYGSLGALGVVSVATGVSLLPIMRERLATLRQLATGMPESYPIWLGAGLLLANMRDPEPFVLASKGWESVAKSANDSAQEIHHQIETIMAEGWRGIAATGFREHVDMRFVPALLRYHDHADAMAQLGKIGADVLDKSLTMALGMVMIAIVMLMAFRAIRMMYPQSRIVVGLAAGVWLMSAYKVVAILAKQYGAFSDVSGKVADQAELVRRSFLDDAPRPGPSSDMAGIKPVTGTVWVPPAGEEWTPEEWDRQWKPA
ncbi:hypothetical protein GCM10022226_56180 [Sphaerisporangium flaviroseum]|uniref:DUF4231 domain-containing protein n=1 Tax=Sphaerisporangium flaviroseum TaxID=509199 RepID=A0ABP7IW86_9ACTN